MPASVVRDAVRSGPVSVRIFPLIWESSGKIAAQRHSGATAGFHSRGDLGSPRVFSQIILCGNIRCVTGNDMTEKKASLKRRMAVRQLPLGIGRQTPMAEVTYAEIEPLLDPLKLPDDVRLELCASVRQIMARYLGQKMSAEDHDDHATSLKALRAIEKQAGAVARELDSIKPDFLVELDKLRDGMPNLRQLTRSHFDFLHLTDQLHDLGQVAGTAATRIKPKERKRPPRVNLDQAVSELSDAIRTATGHAPRRSRSQGSVPVRRLVGREDAFLLGSGPIDQSQKMTVAARAMAEKKAVGHLS